MRHSYGCRSNSILVFLALVLLLPNDRFQAHADADLQDNEDLSEYLYLKERKSDVYPIDEYKKSSPTVVDKTHPDHPDFLYSSNYPHHRIVEFYAHWCPHCKRFKPNYINFARSLQEFLVTSKLENVTIETRAVSCVPNQQICKDMEIHSYPTVKFFPAFSMNGTTAHIYDLHPLQTLRVFQLYQEQPANITESTKTEPDAKTFNLRNHFKRPLKTTQLVFMDRTQQEIYNDAHLSFAFALKTAIFMGNGPGQPLDPSPQMHFQDFLRILQNGLPPSMSLQPLLADLLDPFEFVVMSDDHLQEVLGRHPAPATEWSPSCLKHDSGYTCGLWQLFHIMSIGIVEWNQLVPIASSEDLILPPMGVADALRNYISDFFGCDDCRTHFLKEYDACHHDRCNRLIDHRAGGTRSDWIELPLWLFEMHNGVNSRLRNERIADYQDNNGGNKEETTEQDVLWPPKEKCPRCWLSDGRWDEQMVYLYMRLEYWYVASYWESSRRTVGSRSCLLLERYNMLSCGSSHS